MRKIFTKLIGATLGLAMAIGVGVGVAANNRVAKELNAAGPINFVAGTDSSNTTSIEKSGITISLSSGVLNRSDNYRVYASGTMTISSTVGNITNMVFDGTGAQSGKTPSNLSTTNGTYSYAGSTGTWTGNSASVVFTTGAQSQIKSIAITYTASSGTQLGTPAPTYSSETGNVTWEDIPNASSYDVTVPGLGTRHNATSPFSTSAFPVPGAYTVSVTAIGDGENYIDSPAGTVTFAKLNKAGTEAEPYDIANARAAIDGNAKVANVYVTGVISQVDEFDDEHKSITYWISDDGTTTNQFEVYSGKGLNGADFSSIDDVEIGATVVVYGTIKKFNSTYEFNYNNQLNAYTSPAARDVITDLDTQSSLTYHYTKTGDGVVDILNEDNTYSISEESGTSYKNWTNSALSSGVTYVGFTHHTNNSVQFKSSDNVSGIVVTSNTNSRKVKAISVVWESHTGDAKILDVYGKNSAYDSASDLYSDDDDTLGTSLGTLKKGTNTSIAINTDYEYIGIRSRSGAVYLTSLNIQWDDLPSYTYTNVAIKFGGKVSSALWDRLDSESHGILGYGVMVATAEYLNGLSIKNYYDLARDEVADVDSVFDEVADKDYTLVDGLNIKCFYNEVSKMPRLIDGNYVWDLVKGVNGTNVGLAKPLTSVAFIRTTDDEIIFLQETTKSAAQIADDIYTAELDETLDGSLGNLALLA